MSPTVTRAWHPHAELGHSPPPFRARGALWQVFVWLLLLFMFESSGVYLGHLMPNASSMWSSTFRLLAKSKTSLGPPALARRPATPCNTSLSLSRSFRRNKSDRMAPTVDTDRRSQRPLLSASLEATVPTTVPNSPHDGQPQSHNGGGEQSWKPIKLEMIPAVASKTNPQHR